MIFLRQHSQKPDTHTHICIISSLSPISSYYISYQLDKRPLYFVQVKIAYLLYTGYRLIYVSTITVLAVIVVIAEFLSLYLFQLVSFSSR